MIAYALNLDREYAKSIEALKKAEARSGELGDYVNYFLAVAYSGTWALNTNTNFIGGDSRLSMDAGSRASFTFTGTDVAGIGYRDEYSGIANVYVDGALKGQIDTYVKPSKAQAQTYSVSGLAMGNHTLVIEVTGTKSAASGGASVWVDAFEIATTQTAAQTTSKGCR